MTKQKLTRPFLRKLRCDDPRGQRFFDSELTGFYVRAYPDRAPVYCVMYGPKNRRKQVTIGPADKLTLEEARKRAKELLSQATLGEDPAAEKAELARTLTFSQWVREYMTLVTLHKKSARYDALYLGTAEKHWGSMLLNEITSDDVQRVFELVRREGVASLASATGGDKGRALQTRAKKRWSKKGPKTTTANRWLASVRACLKEAWRRKKIKELPAMLVRLLPENDPRTRVLSDGELFHLLQAISEHPNEFTRAAFTILIETGCRLSEVLRARWEHLDLDGRLWHLPSPKAGKPQIQALTDSTVALLRNLPRVGTYVIPGRFPERVPEKPRADLTGPWTLVLTEAKAKYRKAWAEIHPEKPAPPPGFLEGVTIHDLRRTFGLHVARKAGVHVASKLLRHSSVEVTARIYAPLGVDELRKAMEDVNEDRGKVLPMRRNESTS